MRSTVLKLFVGVMALGLASAGAKSSEVLMSDPLFGLDFNPEVARFDSAPAIVVADLHLRAGRYWLFASVVDKVPPRCEYVIVAGLAPHFQDTDPPVRIDGEPDVGVLAVSCGGAYRALGVPDRMYSELGLPNRVVQALCKDGVARSIRAFGGKKAVRSALLEQWRGVPELPKPLMEALRSRGVLDGAVGPSRN